MRKVLCAVLFLACASLVSAQNPPPTEACGIIGASCVLNKDGSYTITVATASYGMKNTIYEAGVLYDLADKGWMRLWYNAQSDYYSYPAPWYDGSWQFAQWQQTFDKDSDVSKWITTNKGITVRGHIMRWDVTKNPMDWVAGPRDDWNLGITVQDQ